MRGGRAENTKALDNVEGFKAYAHFIYCSLILTRLIKRFLYEQAIWNRLSH